MQPAAWGLQHAYLPAFLPTCNSLACIALYRRGLRTGSAWPIYIISVSGRNQSVSQPASQHVCSLFILPGATPPCQELFGERAGIPGSASDLQPCPPGRPWERELRPAFSLFYMSWFLNVICDPSAIWYEKQRGRSPLTTFLLCQLFFAALD